VAESWIRCLDDYSLTPDSRRLADVLTNGELRQAKQRQETLLISAEREIDRLFKRLSGTDALVTLASPDGVMLTFRCDPYWRDELRKSGVELGSIWAEESQGTNGVGTCLKTGQSLSIVGDEHFNSAVKSLTCMVAPIPTANGRIGAVLNVTSMRPESPRTASILRTIVERSARRIEFHDFTERNGGAFLVDISLDGDFSDTAERAVLAVNDSGALVDFSSTAPLMLGKAREHLIGMSLESLLLVPRNLESGVPIAVGGTTENLAPLVVRAINPRLSLRKPMGGSRTLPPPPKRSEVVMTFADPRFDRKLSQADRLLRANVPLTIIGEVGAGKSSFAMTLAHRIGGHLGDVVDVDCSASSVDVASRLGLVRHEGHRTVVLDRIDELAPPAQRLLISLIDQAGDGAWLFRLISVTAAGLANAVSEGRFRQDLADRLAGGIINLPPLRTAPNLSAIIREVFDSETTASRRNAVDVSIEALTLLEGYHWPGNLRELRNAVRHALAVSTDKVTIADLPDHIVEQLSGRDMRARSQFEAARIEAALRYHGGNVAQTAKYLGISRATLYRKVQVGRPPNLVAGKAPRLPVDRASPSSG
jgi:transcriptional regulator of acetoin/glycerol metabolism